MAQYDTCYSVLEGEASDVSAKNVSQSVPVYHLLSAIPPSYFVCDFLFI